MFCHWSSWLLELCMLGSLSIWIVCSKKILANNFVCKSMLSFPWTATCKIICMRWLTAHGWQLLFGNSLAWYLCDINPQYHINLESSGNSATLDHLGCLWLSTNYKYLKKSGLKDQFLVKADVWSSLNFSSGEYFSSEKYLYSFKTKASFVSVTNQCTECK